MANIDEIDLLAEIRQLGIMPERTVAEMQAKVESGQYPRETSRLTRALIQDGSITEFQAKRLLTGRGRDLLVGRYVIVDRLGRGSMGEVFKAQHVLMGRAVAVKKVSGEISANDKAVARFLREIRLIGRLDHPNVVRAFDADARGRLLYLVMEFVQGQSLLDLLKQGGPMKVGDVINYMTQSARGLHHAHAQGVVHRDIKPSNLLLNDQDVLKILDLGLGVLMEADPSSSFQTADGIAVGTVDFMSPEQAMGRDVDGRSDLFSLGCSMYYLLTGRFPFPGNSQIERLGRRINSRPEPIKALRPEIPDRVVAVMEKLLANKPADRYQTGNEAADALAMLSGKSGVSASVASRGPKETLGPGANSISAPAPAAQAPGPVRVVTPKYPGWFKGLAKLASRSGGGALLIVLLALLAMFGAGFGLAWALK